MLPLHHMRYNNIFGYLHPTGLEPILCSSEVRRVTNYAKDALI